MQQKKIGIYAGAFDPIHQGHLAFAREAARQGSLDRVFFLVEPRPRYKQGVKALEHRNRMVQLAIRHEPLFGSITIDQLRFTLPETLPRLRERFKGAELYLLMGDDVLRRLSHWPHIGGYTKEVRFIIGARKLDHDQIHARLKALQVARSLHLHYTLFDAPKPTATSRAIRMAYKKNRPPASVPLAVRHYIKAEGLYTSAMDGS